MLVLVLVLASPAAPLAAFEWTSARPWFAGSSVGARGGSSAGGGRGSEAGAKRALEETAVHDHRKRPVKIAANGDEDDANLLQGDMLEPPACVICIAWVSAAAIHVSLMQRAKSLPCLSATSAYLLRERAHGTRACACACVACAWE